MFFCHGQKRDYLSRASQLSHFPSFPVLFSELHFVTHSGPPGNVLLHICQFKLYKNVGRFNKETQYSKSCIHRKWHCCIFCFIRSFIRGGGWTLSIFWRAFGLPPALRPRHGPVCYSPLTLELVLYTFSGRMQTRGLPIRPLTPTICCPHRRLSPHPDAPNPGVMACHILKRTQTNPLYLPENNFIARSCRSLTRHDGRGGRRTHTLPN